MDDSGNVYCYTHYNLHAINPQGAPLWQTRTDVVGGELHIVDGALFVVGNFIQVYTLDGKQVNKDQIGIYIPGDLHQQYCIGDNWYYPGKGFIQAVRP